MANGMFATLLGSSNLCLALAFMRGLNLKENVSISIGCQEKLEGLVHVRAPTSFLVEINEKLVLMTSCIRLNAFLVTDGWRDRL